MPESINEKAKKFPYEPLVETMVFRCPKQMSVGIKTYAMSNNLDTSSLMRALIADAAKRFGIKVHA